MLRLINTFFTLYIVFPSILILGAYLTYRLHCVQLSKLKMSFSHLFKKREQSAEGDISQYQAIASVLAGNLGTGNISGMAIALTTGGPGALVWMWLMAFFGAAIQYASCILGVKYRQKNPNGEFVGGPMYYLRDGLGHKSLAAIFSLCTIFGAFTVGNLAQVNSMVLPIANFGIPALWVGCSVAVLVALVILGGMKRFAQVSSAIVPLMAIIYLGAALFVLCTHANQILPSLQTIFRAAWGGTSLGGGVMGFTVMKALTTGFDRAIFATDAGTGIVPILQAGTRTKDPVTVGIVALVSPFVVMVVCTTTALVLMITGVFSHGDLKSTNMVAQAFNEGIGAPVGSCIVMMALILFGYTTTLAWASCLDRAVGFLFGSSLIRPFQFLYISLIPVGAVLHVDFVWILADVALSLMVVTNLIGIAKLSKEVISDTQTYLYAGKETGHEVI